jgi:hypothetical protein
MKNNNDGRFKFYAGMSLGEIEAFQPVKLPKYPEGHCHRCGKKIPVYENMGGRGYEGLIADYFVISRRGGMEFLCPVFKELCLECYREEWREVYSDKPLPV